MNTEPSYSPHTTLCAFERLRAELSLLPGSREKALALTKLDECRHWTCDAEQVTP